MQSKYRSPFRGYRSLLIWLYCVLWMYPLFGHNWHRKWWYALAGAGGAIRAEIGLRRLTLTVNCGITENWQEGAWARACDTMHSFEGEYDLAELYDHVCLQEQALWFIRGCASATMLYWSSMLVFVGIIASLLTLTCAAFVVLYFETGEPSARWKWWAQGLYFVSLATQAFLVVGYSLVNLNLNDVYKPMDIGGVAKLVFNSPSNVLMTGSYTAWYSAATICVGFVISWWAVMDLRTEDELYYDVVAYQQEQGLNDIEKEVLFGTMFQGGAQAQYGATEQMALAAPGFQGGAQAQYGGYAQGPGHGRGYPASEARY